MSNKELKESWEKYKTTPIEQEKLEHRMKVLFGILKDINQPYDGAIYLDKNGNSADTSSFFTDKKASADVN